MSYYYSHVLAQAIESVLAQTRKPDFIHVVDDSADPEENLKVIDICRKYGVPAHIRTQNMGIVDNFNDALFNIVNTEKVMMLGADNWLRPDALECMDTDADIVSCDIQLFGTEAPVFADKLQKEGQDITQKNGVFLWKFHRGNINSSNYIHGSALYRADVARSAGGYTGIVGAKRPNEDYVMWKDMINSGATHKHITKPLLIYRRHKDNFLSYDD